jgi:hypothetical protein
MDGYTAVNDKKGFYQQCFNKDEDSRINIGSKRDTKTISGRCTMRRICNSEGVILVC